MGKGQALGILDPRGQATDDDSSSRIQPRGKGSNLEITASPSMDGNLNIMACVDIEFM
jgi:hypothetical protein